MSDLRRLSILRRRATGAIVSATLLAATPAPFAGHARAETGADRGRIIAERDCSRCHATGPTGESPNAKSPPLRTLAAKYPLENLEEALAEGIVVSHSQSDMPRFEMEPADIEDLIAYLQQLGQKR